MKRRQFLAVAGALVLACLASPSVSQETYPAKSIRLVVPYAAGGGTDVIARVYADKLGTALGQKVIVENKPGADAAIGAADVARSRPDGYTILFGTPSTHIITPAQMTTPGYDPVRDFAQIGIFGTQSMALLVGKDSKVRTVSELIEQAKANPRKITYASTSSIGRLAGQMFARQAGGLELVDVPYKGAAGALQDFLGGRIDIYPATTASVLELHKAGSVRIIAVLSPKRSTQIPDVPTAIESGLPDYLLETFNILSVPAATPRPIIAKLAEATSMVGRDSKVIADLNAAGLDAYVETDEGKVEAFIEDYRKRLAPLLTSN